MKSQSAMEYLMTYGWAILIIAVVLAVLFQLGVFSGGNFLPKAQAGSCQVSKTIAGVSLEGQCNGMLPEYVGQFNGNNGNIIISDSGTGFSLLRPENLTVSTWVYTTSSVATQSMVAHGHQGYGALTYELTTSDFCVTTSSSVCLVIGGINKNTWYNVVGTVSYDGTNSIITAYVNGVQTAPMKNSGTLSYAYSTPLVIGQGASGCCSFLDGYLTNVQIYNTSLSPSEVNALYLEGIGGAPIRPQNLVGWWPLNGNTNDYSGNNNNGAQASVTYSSSWESGYSAS